MTRRPRRAVFFGLLIALVAAASASAAVAQSDSTRTGADGQAAWPASLSDYAAALETNYPTLRALVVSRGDCVVFEYYRKDVNANESARVYSVSKRCCRS